MPNRHDRTLDAELHYNLAVLYQQQGCLERAAISYERAIAIDPSLLYAYNNLGCVWIQLGQYDRAIAILNQALTIDRTSAEIYNNLGKTYLQKREWDRAAAFCFQAIALEPDLLAAYDNLGKIYYQKKRFSSALQCWKKVLQSQPNSVRVHSQCASALISQKNYLEATLHLQKIVELEQKWMSAYCQRLPERVEDPMEQLIAACGQLLKHLQAKTHLDQLKNHLSLIYLYLGEVIASSFNREQAELCYQTSVALQPNHLEKTWITPNHKNKRSDSSVPCLGLDCQPCLQNIRQTFKPQVLALGIEQYFPAEQLFCDAPKHFTIIPKGQVWVDPKTSWWNVCCAIAVFKEQHLVTQFSPFYPTPLPGCEKLNSSHHPIFKLEHLPSLQVIDGRVAVLSGLSGNIYFHWMIDILPRLQILRETPGILESIDYFLFNSTEQNFQQETLQKLGIPDHKIIESDRISYLQASELIIPDFPTYTGWAAPSTIEFLRDLFEQQKPNLKSDRQRIYLSRNRARYRRVLNEQEVIDSLTQFGFEVMEMESMSVQAQAHVFARARVIIAPHGSGLTNLVFCQPETVIVELVSPHYIRHYYWVISQYLGLKHYSLKSKPLGCSFLRSLMYPNPAFEDLWVPIESLIRLLKIVI